MVSKPHGERLVDRVVRGSKKHKLLREAEEMVKVEVDDSLAADILNIAHGVYSPLEGFLVREEYENVLYHMRLSNDTPWSIPIILDVGNSHTESLREGDSITLSYNGEVLAIMRVEEVYDWDKREYCRLVYKTLDPQHPGVAKTMSRRELLVGGKIELIKSFKEPFEEYRLWPKESRVLFEAKGWKRIVGFQTRNVPHLGHEYVQKAALTFTDGLFINPLVGWKKPGDYRDEVIVEAYKALVENYFPRGGVVFSVLRMEMRYAGPREAIHHAIVRKNFGCTHFIVGRDHAGVGDYYKPYEAWEIFNNFPDLGITPLFIREAFYCKKCMGVVNEKVCPHPEAYRVKVSGTKIRKLLMKRLKPPETMMRPEVAEAILRFKKPFY